MVPQLRTLCIFFLVISSGLAVAQVIPDLTGYDRETRQTMELACISDKVNGPVAYGSCLNRQIASLQISPGIPDLGGYDRETRQTMELACVSERVSGPVAYGKCLNRQIASLQGSPGIPNLGGYDRETRQTMELACVSDRVNGPVAYGSCLNRQVASLQNSPGIPDLGGYDRETRQTMELACVSERVSGPVAYGKCLNKQIASLQSSPGIANPSSSDSETRQTAAPTSGSGVASSEAGRTALRHPKRGGANSENARGGATAVLPADGSRYATQNTKIDARAPFFDTTMLVLLFVFLLLYFVPTIVASSRGRHNSGAIFVLNLFLGWSMIGWVVSLVWAVSSDRPPAEPPGIPK